MTIIANRDEGLKCVEIARKALEAGNVDKARRFAQKAIKLFPGEETSAFLTKVNKVASQSNRQGPSPSYSTDTTSNNNNNFTSHDARGPSGMGATSGLRQRGHHTDQHQSSANAAADEDHRATPEQRKLVARVIAASGNYYEILEVEKTANAEEIKRAYKKLGFKVHPDKNKARGADEAFKSVYKAFTCLSDPSKREYYDRYGFEPGSHPGANGPGGGMNPFNHMRPGGGGGFTVFEDEIDPEEIFRMFFGGNPFAQQGFNTVFTTGARHGQHRRQQAAQQQGQRSPELAFFKLLASFAPIILIILINVFSSPSKPSFSLQQTRYYSSPVYTMAHQVPYFVRNAADFSSRYPMGSRERTRVELSVEYDWKQAMQQSCYQERLLKRRFEYYGQKERAERVQLTSCQELEKKFGKVKS